MFITTNSKGKTEYVGKFLGTGFIIEAESIEEFRVKLKGLLLKSIGVDELEILKEMLGIADLENRITVLENK